MVVNSSGSVLETRDYYPFTSLRSVSRPSASCGLETPGRSYLSGTKAKENFTGHERDAETGMLYAGARYYMPNVGRWTRVDPALTVWDVDRLMHHQAFSWSPYVYVKNDPIGRFDPDGFTDWPALAKGSVKLAGGLFMTVGGYKTMAAGGVTVAASGGGSAPVSVPMMLGGKALATFGLTQVGFGLAEISSAWLTPDGMSAATYRNIAGIVAEQFADDTTAEAVNLVVDFIAGGKDIGKNMVLDRVVPALLDAAAMADDIMGLLKAYEAEHLTSEDNDNEYRTDTRAIE